MGNCEAQHSIKHHPAGPANVKGIEINPYAAEGVVFALR